MANMIVPNNLPQKPGGCVACKGYGKYRLKAHPYCNYERNVTCVVCKGTGEKPK